MKQDHRSALINDQVAIALFLFHLKPILTIFFHKKQTPKAM